MSVEELFYQLMTQEEPALQFARNMFLGRNIAKSKSIKVWKSMKSILFAFGLGVGAEHLATEPSPKEGIYPTEASAWAASDQISQLQPTWSH